MDYPDAGGGDIKIDMQKKNAGNRGSMQRDFFHQGIFLSRLVTVHF
jgi:hypothetical protein